MVMVKISKGFTLIELMLATSLLMLVMFSGYYAYGLYSQKWQKRVQVFWQGTEQIMGLDVVNQLFISANGYVVKCKNNISCIYFYSSSKKIRFITDSPIYSKGSAIVELIIAKEVDKGTFKLTYKEKNLRNSSLLVGHEDESFQWEKTTVLLSDLQSFQWSLFGWKTFNSALSQSNIEEYNSEDFRQWYVEHDASLIRVLPTNIELQFSSSKSELTTKLHISLPNHTIFKLIAELRNDA